MNSTPIWQKSKSERTAAFAKVFATMTPAERTEPSLAQQLRSVCPLIVQERNQGFTVDQICEGLKQPDIAITASPVSVRRILREADRKAAKRRKARLAALLAKPASGATVKTAAATTTGASAVTKAVTPGASTASSKA